MSGKRLRDRCDEKARWVIVSEAKSASRYTLASTLRACGASPLVISAPTQPWAPYRWRGPSWIAGLPPYVQDASVSPLHRWRKEN